MKTNVNANRLFEETVAVMIERWGLQNTRETLEDMIRAIEKVERKVK